MVACSIVFKPLFDNVFHCCSKLVSYIHSSRETKSDNVDVEHNPTIGHALLRRKQSSTDFNITDLTGTTTGDPEAEDSLHSKNDC